MYHISRMFLQSITIDISDFICWNDIGRINSNRLKKSDVQVNKTIDVYISMVSLIDNKPVPLSKYPPSYFLSIDTSDLM